MVIYQIVNKINGMRYIGQTKRKLSVRWKQHCQSSPPKKCPYIYYAIQKYGEDNFTIEIIDKSESLEELNAKEEFWIKFLDTMSPNGYNLTGGGDNKIISDETRKKLSESNKGRVVSEETRRKIRDAQIGEKNHRFGKKNSEEHKKKLSEIHKGNKYLLGKKQSEETIKKRVESLKKQKRSEETIKKVHDRMSGKNNPFYGKKHSEESLKKMRTPRKGNFKKDTTINQKYLFEE